MRTWTATSTAAPDAAWRLLSRPAAWPAWAPHLAGAWGLGEPEVRTGAVGAARLLGVIPVPARIVAKRPGRSWTWQVAPGVVRMEHRVEPREGGGCTVAIDLDAPAPLERALAAAYGPVIRATLTRLARRAASSRVPAWPVCAAALPVGFAVAQAGGVRPVGGAVMVALLGAGMWVARERAGAPAFAGVGALALGAFVASHLLHDALTVPGAVGLAGAVVGGTAWALLDRRAARGALQLRH